MCVCVFRNVLVRVCCLTCKTYVYFKATRYCEIYEKGSQLRIPFPISCRAFYYTNDQVDKLMVVPRRVKRELPDDCGVTSESVRKRNATPVGAAQGADFVDATTTATQVASVATKSKKTGPAKPTSNSKTTATPKPALDMGTTSVENVKAVAVELSAQTPAKLQRFSEFHLGVKVDPSKESIVTLQKIRGALLF